MPQRALPADYECADCQARALLEKRILINSGCSKPPFICAFELGWSGLAPEPLPGPTPSLPRSHSQGGRPQRTTRPRLALWPWHRCDRRTGCVRWPGAPSRRTSAWPCPGGKPGHVAARVGGTGTFVTKPRDWRSSTSRVVLLADNPVALARSLTRFGALPCDGCRRRTACWPMRRTGTAPPACPA